MNATLLKRTALAATLVAAAGCQPNGINIARDPLESVRKVATTAAFAPAELEHLDFIEDGKAGRYRPHTAPFKLTWINAERFGELCQDYFAKAGLFQKVRAYSGEGRGHTGDTFLVFRPRVTVRQEIRPSVPGTALSLGTAFLYNVLGGPDAHRRIRCTIDMEVQGPSGRHIKTFHASGESAERLVSDGADQLGPLVNRAFTEAIEDVADNIMVNNDLLMMALSADLAAKGLLLPPGSGHMRIQILDPKPVLVEGRVTQISGQIIGVNRPVELRWSVNGSEGGEAPLRDTDAESVKRFVIDAPLPEGIAKIRLWLRPKGAAAGPREDLPGFEIAYLVRKGKGPPPEIRNRWALIIGVGEYAHSRTGFEDLKYAAEDARAFSRFLAGPQGGSFPAEHIRCLTDEQATLRNVRAGLFEFLSQAGKDDLVVIFVSAHGLPQPGTRNCFLACHDTHPDHLPSTGFAMWDVETALRKFIPAERVVVLADACHSGAMAVPGAKGPGDNPVHRYFERLAKAGPGRLVFTASKEAELAYEGAAHGGGVFTRFLLDGLKGAADADGNAEVSAAEIIEYVQVKVSAATKGKQNPTATGQYDPDLPLSTIVP